MIENIFGIIAAFLGGVVPMQLLVGKAYAFDEYVDRDQEPKRYWTLNLMYTAVAAGALFIAL